MMFHFFFYKHLFLSFAYLYVLCFLLLVSRDYLYIFIINPLSVLSPSFSLAFSFINISFVNGRSNINKIKYIYFFLPFGNFLSEAVLS